MAGSRQAQPVELTFLPGLYTNETDRGAKNRWVNGDNVRWNDGLPEKVGGYELSDLVDSVGNPTTYMGKIRSTWEWDSLDSETWIAMGTACKLYLINRGVLYDITPLRQQSNVVNGFTTTAASTTVTVVDPNHGAQDGDHFKILTDVTVGGITIPAGEYNINLVVDLNSFTFTAPSAAVSGATSVGTVAVQYDISCGLESDGPLYGYGVGTYGTGTYGTARTTSTYIGKMRVWSLDNWGEDLLASPSGETLYEWRRTWGPDSRARVVVGAPANIERMMVGPDDRHVLAFGTNLQSTGVHDKMFTRWCKGDDYSDWVQSAANDAGSKRLDTGSRLITSVKTNQGILTFADKALYFVSLIGGTDVYQILLRGRTPEIISPEAALDVDGDVYFMSKKDFYLWNGTLQLMPCDIRTKVFGTKAQPGINMDMAGKITVRRVSDFNEIWWSYPEFGQTENSAAAIYNYALKCWYWSSIPREAGRDSSPAYGNKPYAFYNHRFWIHETGNDGDDGEGFVVAIDAFISSCERDLLDGAVEVRLHRLIPDFDSLDGQVEVTVFGREQPQAAATVLDGPVLVFNDTELIAPDIRVRQVGIKIESKDDLGVSWRMGTWIGYATPVGRKSA